MQSGISASSELHAAFAQFTSERSNFVLPVNIANEKLIPLDPLPFHGDFNSSLPSLEQHLQPKTPIYLIIRTSAEPQHANAANLVAITYVPSTAPVRSKTLFASTRATLIRDLGVEKFSEQLFCTDAEEVLDPKQWDERTRDRSKDAVDAGLLSAEERELQKVKRAEEEERHGTQGRDLMGEGGSGASTPRGTGSSGIRMKITDEAQRALKDFSLDVDSSSGGNLLQLGIDVSIETLTLLSSKSDIKPSEVPRSIPASQPSYTFYHFPSTSSVIFMYVCPGSAKVKERMIYASSRISVLKTAEGEGIKIAKRLEAGSPEEISEQRLSDEAGVNATTEDIGASKKEFSKPKRPGRR